MNESSKALAAILKKSKTDVAELIDHLDIANFTALHWCSVYGKADHIKILLKSGANPTVVDRDEKTALHWATETDAIDSIRPFLVDPHESIIGAQDKEGKTALHIAVSQGNLEMVTELCAMEGLDVNTADVSKRTPLHWAAAADHYEIIEVLFGYGANPMLRDETGASASHYAAQKGENTLRVLLQQDNFAHEPDNEGRYPAHWAVMRGEVDIIKDVLDRVAPTTEGGVDAIQDNEGRSLLHFAVASEAQDVAALLIDTFGSSPNVKDANGQAPLSAACENGFAEMIAFLVDRDADLNTADNDGRTPLHWVAVSADQESLDVLSRTEGLDYDAQDESGKTSLAYAAYQGHQNVVLRVGEQGGSSNIVDNDSVSPLHWAASEGYGEIVQILLNQDAYPNYMDRENKSTPFDYAVMNGHEEIAELIASYGGLSFLDIQQLAILTIQTCVRGWIAKKQYTRMKNDKFISEATLEEHQAATLIGARFRGFSKRRALPRMKEEAAKKEQENAAVKIQAGFRGMRDRKSLASTEAGADFTKKMKVMKGRSNPNITKARRGKPLVEVYQKYVHDSAKRKEADRKLYRQLITPLGRGLGEMEDEKAQKVMVKSMRKQQVRLQDSKAKAKMRKMMSAATEIQTAWRAYLNKCENGQVKYRGEPRRRSTRPIAANRQSSQVRRASLTTSETIKSPEAIERHEQNDALLTRMGVKPQTLPAISRGTSSRYSGNYGMSRRAQSGFSGSHAASHAARRKGTRRTVSAVQASVFHEPVPQPRNVTFALKQFRSPKEKEIRAQIQDLIRRDAREQSARYTGRRMSGGLDEVGLPQISLSSSPARASSGNFVAM